MLRGRSLRIPRSGVSLLTQPVGSRSRLELSATYADPEMGAPRTSLASTGPASPVAHCQQAHGVARPESGSAIRIPGAFPEVKMGPLMGLLQTLEPPGGPRGGDQCLAPWRVFG